MSLLHHVVHYFTSTWKESAEGNYGVEVAGSRFVGDFLEPFEESLGPFHRSDEEALAVTCERSAGTLSLTVPGGGGRGSYPSWLIGASTSIASAAINLGTNELSWSLESDDVEVTAANSAVGPVLVSGGYDHSSRSGTAALKAGPLATRIAVTPATNCPGVDSHRDIFFRGASLSSPFLSRYYVVSEFSAFFPRGVSHGPNLRCGVRTSNDPDEAPVVLGCALWPGTPGQNDARWSLAAVLALTSLIHVQCQQGAGVVAQYLSSSRGPATAAREDDELSIAVQRRFSTFGSGALTVSSLVRLPVGPGLALSETDCKVSVALATTAARFPTMLRAAVHSTGDVCGGVEITLPSFSTGLGAMWDAAEKTAKFGLEVSC